MGELEGASCCWFSDGSDLSDWSDWSEFSKNFLLS